MLIIFFLTSLLITFSMIGYGLMTTKFLKIETINYNYGLLGILGFFLLSVISSYTHLIFPHNYLHNIIIILLGLIYLISYKQIDYRKSKYLIIIFSLLFISILLAKTNEDFGYYHLPNSLQFVQQKLQFGLGNLNHGFKHISSIFMLMSLTYLPLFDHYLFNLINFLFLVFFVYFILSEIYFSKNKNSNTGKLIISFFLILFLTKFSRIAEYGTDLAGQMLIAITFFFIIELLFSNKLNYEKKIIYFKLSIILIIFSVSTKFILIIYSILFLTPFIYFKEKQKLLTELVKYNFLVIALLPVIFFIFFNFTSTGCIIYPIPETCFSNVFDWALSKDTVNYLNLHYELWSKGGMGPNFRVEGPELYVEKFNWLSNWISVYFFNKFSDYILVIFAILLSFCTFFYKEIFLKKIKKINIYHDKIKYLYLLLFFIFFIWFIKFPTLRYAGYLIVFIVFTLPIIYFLSEKIQISEKFTLKKLSILFLIAYFVFVAKNSSRIYNELLIAKSNHHNFKNFPFYWVEDINYKKIYVNNYQVYKVYDNKKCWSTPSTCIRSESNLKIRKKNNYIFYSIKK